MASPASAQSHGPLAAADGDLRRLKSLLADACDALLDHFAAASASLRADPPQRDAAIAQLGAAVTALQFQDLAQQLIDHTQATLAQAARGAAPSRSNPVTQSAVDSGSVELF